VHRDWQPGNIQIKADDAVKVLDFGLAEVAEPTLREGSPEESRLTFQAAREEVIPGRAAYVSPEQARDRQVDQLADLCAIGMVFFEMLTRRQTLCGETVTDVLAAVAKEEPDLTRVPTKVWRLLQFCLQKNWKQRLQAIGDY
jgi:serine/threonine protein kinase